MNETQPIDGGYEFQGRDALKTRSLIRFSVEIYSPYEE